MHIHEMFYTCSSFHMSYYSKHAFNWNNPSDQGCSRRIGNQPSKSFLTGAIHWIGTYVYAPLCIENRSDCINLSLYRGCQDSFRTKRRGYHRTSNNLYITNFGSDLEPNMLCKRNHYELNAGAHHNIEITILT